MLGHRAARQTAREASRLTVNESGWVPLDCGEAGRKQGVALDSCRGDPRHCLRTRLRKLHSPCVLVAARVLTGMSQSDLAAAAGTAISSLPAIEQGRP
jgi:hypothetical protein